MKIYECDDCGKKFDKKSNYDRHKNKKISCNKAFINEKINIQNDSKDKLLHVNSKKIDGKLIKQFLDECKCGYCGKEFARKDNVIYHIKNNCKKVKEIEEERNQIFMQLKEEEEKIQKIKKLEEEQKLLKEENKKNKEETLHLKKDLDKLKKELDKIQNSTKNNNNMNHNKNNSNNSNIIANNKLTNNNINTINNSNNNSNNNNNNTINNQQNITLVEYKNEDLNQLDKNEILTIMKRGFQAPVELTRTIHFNPKYPEYHNIFIPKINEKYGMVYMNSKWRLIDKNELVEDIYENKRDFIIQNLDNFINQLDEYKKKSLRRWLNTDDNDNESIINTKEDIKRLLYDNRHLAMDKKRIMDREARKLMITSLPKKVVAIKAIKTIEELDLDLNLDKDKSENFTNSSYESNYDYDSKYESSNDSESSISDNYSH
jgi:hypothetical protein